VNDESRDKVSLKKAVKALETLIKEMDRLPAAQDARRKHHTAVEGMRKQLEGMVLTLKGACQGRSAQDDFSFPGA
jgi:phage shock protein A